MQSHECMQALCPLLSVPNPSFKWHECEKSSPNYTTLWKCVIGTSVSHNTVTAIWEYQRRDPCHMGSAWQPWDGMRWDGMGWGGVGWDGMGAVVSGWLCQPFRQCQPSHRWKSIYQTEIQTWAVLPNSVVSCRMHSLYSVTWKLPKLKHLRSVSTSQQDIRTPFTETNQLMRQFEG